MGVDTVIPRQQSPGLHIYHSLFARHIVLEEHAAISLQVHQSHGPFSHGAISENILVCGHETAFPLGGHRSLGKREIGVGGVEDGKEALIELAGHIEGVLEPGLRGQLGEDVLACGLVEEVVLHRDVGAGRREAESGGGSGQQERGAGRGGKESHGCFAAAKKCPGQGKEARKVQASEACGVV
jgi:hypothetical protein